MSFENSSLYSSITNFYNTKDDKSFIQFMAEFYNQFQPILDEQNINKELILELQNKFTEFKELGFNNQEIMQKIEELLPSSQTIQNIKTNINNINLTKVDNTPLYIYSPYKNSKQGDCAILKYKDKVFIIDVGLSSTIETVISYIKTKGITKVDYMLITHYHIDHCQGFSEFLDSGLDFSNCVFYLPPQVEWSNFVGSTSDLEGFETSVKTAITNKGLNYIELTNGYKIEIEDLKIRFLNCNTNNYQYYYDVTIDSNGPTEKNTTNYNNFAVPVIVEHNKTKLLFASDIDITAQEKIVNELCNVDFMTYPHHCCNEISCEAYHRVLSPKICLATGVGFTRYSSSDLIRMFNISASYSNNINFEMESIGNTLKVIEGRKIMPYSTLGQNSDSITSGSDLNNYVYSGEYYSTASSISSTLSNTPITDSGFRLKVRDIVSGVSVIQTIIANNANIIIYERYINLVNSVYGEWIELTQTSNNYRLIPTTDDTLSSCISKINDYNFKVLNISTSNTIYNELSDKITDSHGLYLKIEKINGNYSILTLTGKSIEKMFIGHYISGNITWKEVSLI